MKAEKKEITKREALTRRQLDFAYWVVKVGSAEAAALKAGYTPDTASAKSGKMMKNPLIQKEIDRVRERLAPRIIATLQDKERRLWEIANDDDKDAAIKAIDIMLKIRGEYASTKIEVDSRNININATIELKDIQEIRKKYQKEI